MFQFFSHSVFGDPSSEMDAFRSAPLKSVQGGVKAGELMLFGSGRQHPKTEVDGCEVGRVVGKNGSNFIVQIGNERREVPPTDIVRVLN